MEWIVAGQVGCFLFWIATTHRQINGSLVYMKGHTHKNSPQIDLLLDTLWLNFNTSC